MFGRKIDDFGSMTIRLSSHSSSATIQSVDIDLDEWLRRSCVRERWIQLPGSNSEIRVAVFHRTMENQEERNALEELCEQGRGALNEKDLQHYGRLFPDLWYAIPEEQEILEKSMADRLTEVQFRVSNRFSTRMKSYIGAFAVTA